ncbi:Scr1 family TA system antitoxin-like transcriptional regulator [Streptomyces sp. NPDC004270]
MPRLAHLLRRRVSPEVLDRRHQVPPHLLRLRINQARVDELHEDRGAVTVNGFQGGCQRLRYGRACRPRSGHQPGPLQTGDYARAVFSDRVPELPAEEVELRVRHLRSTARTQLTHVLQTPEAEHVSFIRWRPHR